MHTRIILFVLGALFASGCGFANSESSSSVAAEGARGMVSSGHPIASDAGLRVLKSGGNAFDAAIAVAAALNVVEPMMSGMGGYGTILIYDAAKKEVRFLDSSGKIPMAVDGDVFRAPAPGYKQNRRGPKAVSTPGNVNAWEAMSKEYGNLPWRELFADAIAVADTGYVLSDRLARFIKSAYPSFPDHAKAFYGTGGRPLAAGERLVQRDLANSLRLIAEGGSRAFYEGELGRRIHDTMQSKGSFLSMKDLTADRAEWWRPARLSYGDFEVFTASPPATAFPSLIRLGMMRELRTHNLQHNSADYLHYFAEVTKHAFWCRLAYAGDPEIAPPPLEKLLSEAYLAEQAARIDAKTATNFEPPGERAVSSKNTTHFVVADRWSNIVSATQTLGNSFGSRIMPEGTGIWFNNSLAYCTFEPPGNPMDAIPGQRKLSGDCPTIIFRDGRPWAALGTPGGHTIGQTVPQMVLNLIEFGMDVQGAISAPRISFIEPNDLFVENGIPDHVVGELRARGHKIRQGYGLGNAHALRIVRDDSGSIARFEGAADPRGEGTAVGW